jgi:hypothetical protein
MVFQLYSLKKLFDKHGVYYFDFLNLLIILLFYFMKCG